MAHTLGHIYWTSLLALAFLSAPVTLPSQERVTTGALAGVVVTFSSGEYVTPTFEITPRFRYVGSDLREIRWGEFAATMGQTIFLEPRVPARFETLLLVAEVA